MYKTRLDSSLRRNLECIFDDASFKEEIAFSKGNQLKCGRVKYSAKFRVLLGLQKGTAR